MQDSLEFIKKMWGGMGVPGMVVPTLSVEEINKKITDLKAVESWLNLNLNMLRTTIQALEVQSATLSALRAMGAVNQPDTDDGEPAANAWSMPSGFPFSFMNPSQNGDAPSASSPTASAAPKQHEPEPPVAPTVAEAAPSSPGNANAWWDLLQNQFKQAVNSVAATEKAAKPASTAAAKSDAKSGPKAPAKPRSKPAAKPAVKKAGSVADGKTKPAAGKAKPAPK